MPRRKKTHFTSRKGVSATGKKIKKTVRGAVEPGSPLAIADDDAPHRPPTFSQALRYEEAGEEGPLTPFETVQGPQQEIMPTPDDYVAVVNMPPVDVVVTDKAPAQSTSTVISIDDCPQEMKITEITEPEGENAPPTTSNSRGRARKRMKMASRESTPSPLSGQHSATHVLVVEAGIHRDAQGSSPPVPLTTNMVPERRPVDLSQTSRALRAVENLDVILDSVDTISVCAEQPQRPDEGGLQKAILPANIGAEIKDRPAPKRRRIALRTSTTPSPPSQPEPSCHVLVVDPQIYHDAQGNVQPQKEMVKVLENRLLKFDLSQIRRAIQDVPMPQIENAILHTEPAKIRRPARPDIDFDEIAVVPDASFPDDGFEQLAVLFDDELAIFADEIANGGDGMFDDGLEYIETEVVPPVLPAPAPIREENDAAYQAQLEAEIERVRNRRGQKRTYLLAATRHINIHKIGPFNQVCAFCSAKFFRAELTTQRQYNKCCNRGKMLTITPLRPVPALLQVLMTENSQRARNFRKNIQAYNHAFQFVSTRVTFRQIPGRGPLVYAIQGKIYHQIGDVNVNNVDNFKYGPIYFLDPEMAVQQRLNNDPRNVLDADLVRQLTDLMEETNPFAQSYFHLNEVYEQQRRDMEANGDRIPVVCLEFVAQHRNRNDREHDPVAVSEVAALYHMNADVPPSPQLAVFVRGQNVGLREVNYYSEFCDPLTYPLLFPNGELGWSVPHYRIPHRITPADFYSYRLAYRDMPFSLIHRSGRLHQQYVVDAFIKVESDRLEFYRRNQDKFRVDSYQGLTDYLNRYADDREAQVGAKVILPSDFLGGPRSQMQKYQDAMAVVQKYGHPSFFITFTCNPRWAEIVENIPQGDEPSNHPLLIARVFKCKLNELMDDLTVKHVFGVPLAHLMVIEFQKRGLPHAHILLTVRAEDKPEDSFRIDQFISAEVPDRYRDPELYELVGRHMIHGPCGTYNQNSVCMQNGKCSKKFPKKWSDVTSVNGACVTYKRPRNLDKFIVIRRNGVEFNAMSPFVVPHNPYLLKKFNTHINVEACVSVVSVKYLYKYFFKSEDQALIEIREQQQPQGEQQQQVQAVVNYDEIRHFVNARYLTPPESSWRLLKFDLHDNSHSIVRLDVHLPNEHRVLFPADGDARAAMENKTTTLLQWFELNQRDHAARQHLYGEIPQHYNFAGKKWVRRVRNTQVIARIYNVSPRFKELYCLRMLLLHVRGATSFDGLKTVAGDVCDTFTDACRRRGLLADDGEWFNCLREAALKDMPKQMRSLFAYILVFGDVQDAPALWTEFRRHLLDFLRRGKTEQEAQDLALRRVNFILNTNGTTLANFGLPEPPALPPRQGGAEHPQQDDGENGGEQNPADNAQEMLANLNDDQRRIFDTIVETIDNPNARNQRLFYLKGAAGTGKTYLYNTLIAVLTSRNQKVITVASTGLSASILRNGRTVHSFFQLPVPVGENTTSLITAHSNAGRDIRETALIIWDEVSISSKHLFHAVERTLRDICNDQTPFASKCVLIGGDFKQCLPIVIDGDRVTIVDACIQSSRFWGQFVHLELHRNMRAGPDEQEYVQFLERLGTGALPTKRYLYHSLVAVPQTCVVESKEALIQNVFGDHPTIESYMTRAILSPLNKDCDELNNLILDGLDGQSVTFHSVDSVVSEDDDEINRFPVEYLNSINLSGYPPHRLTLKVGAVIMLLRNLNVREGLCNGTRLVVRSLGAYTIEAELIDSNCRLTGRREILPKIDLAPSTTTLPFTLKRRQFPVRLSYAVTINKAQGMTFESVGLNLSVPVFAHGQLYVAFSRARRLRDVHVYVERTTEQGKVFSPADDSTYTKNIVYPEVL